MRSPGFWTFDNVFTSDECDDLLARIGELVTEQSTRAGMRNLMSVEAVAKFAAAERLGKICRDVVGEDLIPYKATLFEKTGKANWLVAFHQDTALPVENAPKADGWGPSSLKDGITFSHAPTSALRKILALRIHLDASSTENGPLRVIPDSHHECILNDRDFESIVDRGPVVECLVGKGGVIAMSPLLIHASSKIQNDMPRRVLHIEYASSLDLADDVRLAIA